MKRFDRVRQILEEGVNNTSIGVHGNFWRDCTLEQFKEKKVLGKPLLVVGNADDSNLIKSLEGRAPFGKDIGTAGATINRMPSRMPPISAENITYIRKWIQDGCPDQDDPQYAETAPQSYSLDGVSANRANLSGKRDILSLMSVASDDHDLNWLKEALQNAIQLELTTIPPYLCAMWSIKDTSHKAYMLIREIVLEEMLHMALACNLLNTLGGKPTLNTADVVPTYPHALPGRVRPTLVVGLSRLTCDVLENTFMQIEWPKSGPVASLDLGEEYPTFGDFYDAILDALRKLPDGSIKGTKQIETTVGGAPVFAIKTLADAEKAILEITEQGEGTSQSPYAVDFGGELAHFYKFAEIYHGYSLIKKPNGTWAYEGDPIPFPDVYPMADIPAGGYPAVSGVFDTLYTSMLDSLQGAWETGDDGRLGEAIITMFSLQPEALKLMTMPIRGGHGNYGPSFLLRR